MSKILRAVSVLCLTVLAMAGPAYAVEVTGSGGWAYEQVGEARYQLVQIKGQTAGGATQNAPTYAEGDPAGFSFDLSGNLRTTLGTLLACEDQDNNLCTTSGGVVRGTVGNVVNGAVGDATSSAVAIPVGSKTIEAVITGAGAVAQVIKIYGGTASGMAAATSTLLCTITLSGTSGAAGTEDSCPVITANFLFYKAVTSGSSGTPTTVVTAMY